MNGEHLLNYLGFVEDELIQECCAPQNNRRKHPAVPLRRWLAAAACVCLVLCGTFGAMIKLGYFSAGCGGWPGTIVNGRYYYTVPHSGVWCYVPGAESKKLVSFLRMDGWLVNESGLYFDRGRSLYRKDLTTGEEQRLYTARWAESSHIGFSLKEDGTVVLTVYDKRRERQRQLLLDGETGTVLQELSGWIDYRDIRYGFDGGYPMYEYRYYLCGDAIYELVEVEDLNKDASYDLRVSDRSVLPQGWYVISRPQQEDMNGNLLVEIYTGRRDEAWKTQQTLLIRKDGSTVLLPGQHRYESVTPDGRYLFRNGTAYDAQGNAVQTETIWCLDADTGATWHLTMDAVAPQYEFTTDGIHLYTTAPWAEEQACWRIEYDQTGRPVALLLVSAEIRNAE